MDLLDRLLGHDAWSTRQLLLRSKGLTDEQLDRDFDIGRRTVRATFLHIVRNIEIWNDLMVGRRARPDAGAQPEGRDIPGLIERLDSATAELARAARAVADRDGWDERWLDTMDVPPTEKTNGGAIAHLITHSMHHRAQLFYMLRRLDVGDLTEGDVLSWEKQLGGAPPQNAVPRSSER